MAAKRRGGRKLGEYSQAERVLKLYDDLRRGRTIRIGAAAKELSTSERQIQRDMAYLRGRLALEQLEDGGWRVVASPRDDRLRIARAQILAMELGTKLSGFLWSREKLAAIQARIDTLTQELLPSDKDRLRSWRRRVAVIAPGQKDYASRPQAGACLDVMLDAMVAARPVRLSYRSHGAALAGRPARTLEVHPLGVVFYRDGVYFIVDVVGGDAELRGKRILVALDRIAAPSPGDAGAFIVPRDFDASAFFGDAFGIWRQGEAREVVVEVNAAFASWFQERLLHPSQRIEQRTDGSLLVRMTVSGEVEIVDWMLSLGDHAELVEPAELRAKVRDRLRAASTLYGEGDDIFRHPTVLRSPLRQTRGRKNR